MRPWCIPLSVIALTSLVSASQYAFHSPSGSFSTTLVDVLSADPDYTSLLSLLQRAKLIPTLNKLNGSTLFAPTNDAISRYAASNSLWQVALYDQSEDLGDNVQEKLRQELFYHLLNETLLELPTEQQPQVLRTLHFPNTPIESPTHEPPPYPPWFPRPGGTLGGEPQRLRIAARDEVVFVGVDAFGNGGAQIIKPRVNASNGVLLGIDNVLQVPPDLATLVLRHPSLTYLAHVLTPESTAFLNSTPELTLFLPVDAAWKALPEYEQLYLQSHYATDDLIRIVNMHAVAQKHVKWSDSFDPGVNLTTIDGQILEVATVPEEHKTTISTAELIEPDIYAANGVVHTVSSLLVPPGSLQLTPEKYLLVLNCSSFVSLLHSVNLGSLINDTEAKYTILAPRDDVLSLFGHEDLPKRGTEELKKLLEYHFIPGKWVPKKLGDGMLLETALEESGLGGGRQVLSVDVNDHNSKKGTDRTVRFAGTSIMGEPVEINNTLIYFISRPLAPPADVLTTALPSLELSSFLAAVFSTSLADKLKTTPRTTLLIPPNDAFKRLGMLVSAHLLSASSKPDLERVILHHTLGGVEYAQALQNGTQRTYGTLEGSDINVTRNPNGTTLVTASGGWTGMRSEVYTRDMLTQTGVIHEVSDIMIPRSVELNIGKLVKAAKGTTMATMMVKAGLDWILNGTAPPEGSRWADMNLSGTGWTLLCPTEDAFKKINISQLYADQESLIDIVSQHLIRAGPASMAPPSGGPTNNLPLSLDDSTTYTTLRSASAVYGSLVFRDLENEEGTVVGIKGARGQDGRHDWARVLAWGRATTGGSTGGVVQVDRLLVPYVPPWYIEYGPPVGVGAVGVGLICLFFVGVRAVWRRDTEEATYEPIGGFGQDDDDEA